MANYGFNQYALKMTFQMRNKNENKESMLNKKNRFYAELL